MSASGQVSRVQPGKMLQGTRPPPSPDPEEASHGESLGLALPSTESIIILRGIMNASHAPRRAPDQTPHTVAGMNL